MSFQCHVKRSRIETTNTTSSLTKARIVSKAIDKVFSLPHLRQLILSYLTVDVLSVKVLPNFQHDVKLILTDDMRNSFFSVRNLFWIDSTAGKTFKSIKQRIKYLIPRLRDDAEECKRILTLHKNNSPVISKFLILFTGEPVYGSNIDFTGEYIIERIQEVIPSFGNIDHCLIPCVYGVTGFDSSKQQAIESEGSVFGPCVSGFTFTFPSGVKIYKFCFNDDDTHGIQSSKSFLRKCLKQSKHVFKKEDERSIKCLLLFIKDDCAGAMRLIKDVNQISNCFALGGGIFSGSLDDSYPFDCSSHGLLFCGRQLNAASVIIGEDIKRENEIKEILRGLSKTVTPCMICDTHETHCAFEDQKKNFEIIESTRRCAFMFSCMARGLNLHKDKPSFESKCFSDLFPHIPIVGMFCNGEFGHNSSSHLSQNVSSCNVCFHEHAYCTVFVVLAFHNHDV